MEIVVHITSSAQGHLTGTVRPASGLAPPRDFHGVMELLAGLERIIEVDDSNPPDDTTEGDRTMNHPIEFSLTTTSTPARSPRHPR